MSDMTHPGYIRVWSGKKYWDIKWGKSLDTFWMAADKAQWLKVSNAWGNTSLVHIRSIDCVSTRRYVDEDEVWACVFVGGSL